MRRIALIFMMFVCVDFSFAKERIAKYILDGNLIFYSPNVAQSTLLWDTLMKKTKGVEYINVMNRLDFRIRQKISANIFTPEGAAQMGIDYNGGVAFVQLHSGVSYMVFTVANKGLLRFRLDNLDEPIPYRIEENFVIFSASQDILDFYEFRGINQIAEFTQISKELKLTWNKNLIWVDSSAHKQNPASTLFSMGDRMIGTFNVVENKIVLDVITVYDSPETAKFIVDSMKVKPVQKMTILDYEYGNPGIIGHMYVDISSFYSMIKSIDKAEFLFLITLFEKLKELGVDIQREILSQLKGRFSYTVRAFNIDKKIFDFNISAEVVNKNTLRENLRRIILLSQEKGIKMHYKDLFTQQFYGWEFQERILWMGIVENHLIVSSDEANLVTLVQNIYQGRSRFLERLPTSMNRLIKNKTIGGQMVLKNPAFVQNFNMLGTFMNREFFLSLHQIEWEFYLINNPNLIGRRDIINFTFND